MARIHISNDPSGRIIASFPYDPVFVARVKTVDGRRWHPVDKHWSFPNKKGTLEKILKTFESEEIHLCNNMVYEDIKQMRGYRCLTAF